MRKFRLIVFPLIMIIGVFLIFLNKTVLFSYLFGIIRSLSDTINVLLRELKTGAKLDRIFMFFGISFLYGIIHSLGPGHGKMLIGAYFLKNKHRVWKSVLLAAITCITHTLGAILLAFLLNTILSGIKGMFRIQMQNYIIMSNGILILIVGLLYLFFKIRNKKTADSTPIESNNKNLFLIGITAGMVPCPASLLIMLYAISNDILGFGLLSVIGISLGMFALLVPVGAASITSRDKIMAFSNSFGKTTHNLPVIFEYISILLIIGVGTMMLVASL